MTRFFRSAGNKAFLIADPDSASFRNTSKRTGTLIAFVAFFLFSIWVFTPLSEEAHYKPESAAISNAIVDDTAVAKTSTTQTENLAPAIKTPKQAAATESSDEAPESLSFDSYRTVLPDLVVTPVGASTLYTESIGNLVDEAESDFGTFVEQTQYIALSSADPSGKTLSEAILPEEVQIGPPSGHVKSYIIKLGDSLTKIFSDAELPTSQAIKLAKIEDAGKLNSLSVGHSLRIYFDQNAQWETLEYDYDKLNTLIVTADKDALRITNHTKPVEYREFTAAGVIQTSLGYAAELAGMPEKLAYKLVDIYKWEIDFARDLRKGDTFSVVYQKAYVENEYTGSSTILAASFTTNKQTIEAVRYTDSDGITQYFQPNGESLRRGFLRTPVKLARITSGFGGRRHPIQKTWKQHNGVDYGAKRGTPVLSTADGVVQYAGKKGGYGNTIILRHGGIYTTLYAHLSKFGKGIRTGKSVQQGQVIGHVGRTGWATGDHLHYEFRVEGTHKNPLKVELPKTLPLARKEIESFNLHAEPLLAALATLNGAHVASNLEPKIRRELY